MAQALRTSRVTPKSEVPRHWHVAMLVDVKERIMHRFIVAASLAGLVASSAACARQGTSDSASPVAPSSASQTEARGSGGKPSGGTTGGGTITLKMVADNNSDGKPNWNDTVTFDVATSATESPYVALGCYQNNTLVASASSGFFASYPWPWTQFMTLSSRTWTGGAAECTAQLGYYNSKGTLTVVASVSFHVDA